MSRYDVVAKEPDKYAVTVGWDKPMQTFFAQVMRKDSDRDWDMALWKGTNPREIGSVGELQQALTGYAEIPTEMQNALRFDMGPDHYFDILSTRDKQAITAYETDSRQRREAPTGEGRKQWVQEWRELDEEHRLAGVEAEIERNMPPPDEFKATIFHYKPTEHNTRGLFWLPVPKNIPGYIDYYHRAAVVPLLEYDSKRPVADVLDAVFTRTQGRQDEGVEWNEPSRPTSVGDVILLDWEYYRRESQGWSRLENGAWKEFSDREQYRFKPAERDIDNDMER